MAIKTGTVLIDRYRIVKLLGQGGFGAVYRAWDLRLEGPVAVKVNFDTSREAILQFEREAKILFKLKHTNLPRVSDHFSILGQGQYLVMDYIEGNDLQEMLLQEGGPLPEERVLEWISQVCDALEYLHSQNPSIIHRDIKPANIKITPDGKAMLVDFGIAKIHDATLATAVGARAVTPGFSPLEQYGVGSTNPQSDVYALGATCYALLTGKTPPESIQRVGNDPLVPPLHLNENLSPNTADILLKAMQLDTTQRLKSATEFKTGLSSSQGILQSQILPTVPIAAPSKVGRLPSVLIGVTALIVLVGLILTGYMYNRLNRLASVVGTPTVIEKTIILEARKTEEPPIVPTTINPDPSPEPIYASGDTSISHQDGATLIYIPAGEFLMGSKDVDAGISFDQTPVHKVMLSAYWIDQLEVSNALYLDCVEASVCRAPVSSASSTRKYYFGNPDYANYPVVWITWEDASIYCKWAGRRLPSEAEWERAARGDNGMRSFPWGSIPATGEVANFCDTNCNYDWKNTTVDDGFGDTSPVEYFNSGVSVYGLLNLAGNVWEWVFDFYDKDYYRISQLENPFGPTSGSERVLRGGSFENSALDIRSTNRFYFSQDAATSSFGFRCAADADK